MTSTSSSKTPSDSLKVETSIHDTVEVGSNVNEPKNTTSAATQNPALVPLEVAWSKWRATNDQED